jgi:hypothetical protein
VTQEKPLQGIEGRIIGSNCGVQLHLPDRRADRIDEPIPSSSPHSALDAHPPSPGWLSQASPLRTTENASWSPLVIGPVKHLAQVIAGALVRAFRAPEFGFN